MQLHGLHHLTAISANAAGNHDFYTRVLGLRLVKKTVNQDDTSAYHLFYADGEASPGSDITFFEWPMERERRGTHSVTRTGLRVAGEAALRRWAERLALHGVTVGPLHERDGRLTLEFEDPEGQRLALVDDGGAGAAHPWSGSPVPAADQIRGLGPVTMSVPDLRRTEAFVTDVMAMRRGRRYQIAEAQPVDVQVYEMGEGGPAAELHVRIEPHLAPHRSGAGSVHHVAFRVQDDEYGSWVDRFARMGLRSSGPVDRFYFRSLYVREPGGILFEIATDGPGFDADEPKEKLGERLALPPFLEPKRAEIEAGLKPI
ncbi:ring-cleaving dioxygenase [Pseudoroseomonas globiformis]|uniref:Ring-cleaving dioxygenase n=1 Tax=Teichococcus globiformis TaxID=2307229 RepID=A0ABV7G4H1_9PROT